MPDDLQIPVPGPAMEGRAPISTPYRPRPARDGISPRAVLIGAAALAGTLLVGLGTWSLATRRPATVPVIEADARPIRVKPENPGGMQFGTEEESAGGGADRMAPAAETPAPQALRAQMQPPAAPQAAAEPAPRTAPQTTGPAAGAAAPAAPSAPPQAAPTLAGPAASPLPDTPARAPASHPAAKPPAVAAGAAGAATLVQLAAVETDAAARQEWARLSRRFPDLLGSRAPVIQKAERDGQAVFRVRTGGFTDVAAATSFCQALRAKGGNCTVATF